MDLEDIERRKSALGTILAQFDVPKMRREELTPRNLSWLNRNMAANNKNHPMFPTARQLLTDILRNTQNKA